MRASHSSDQVWFWLLAFPKALIGYVAVAAGAIAALGDQSGGAGVDFLGEVRPVLASHCFKCHGPDEKARKGGLRLDQRDAVLKPAKSGKAAVVAGKPDESELIKRLGSVDPDEVMPPPATKHALTVAQKELLRRWVTEGADFKPHWAFVRPIRPAVPQVAASRSPVRNPIDNFIRARLAKEGLEASAEVDRVTLVRRVYLDLIGLPPSPENVDAFVADPSPEAYESLVDGLLASRHYGERWARRWLDLARYADTNGYEKDRPRSMWPWRDWVINALNDDLPFDQFTIQQIAGDLLPAATSDQRIATGFHRNTMINEEGGVDPLEFRFYSMVDRVHTTATTWLGMTMACAQCHSHKYDPIEHRDYYGFMAFLDNADEPVMDVPDPGTAASRREIEARAEAMTAGLRTKFPADENVTLVTPAASRVIAESGASPERLDDGSYRFSGPTPDKETYTFEFETELTHVTLLNLDVLADDSLPKKGPGRSGNGNFVLAEMEIRAGALSGTAETVPVKIASATADFEQGGFPARDSLDGKRDTGWGISGDGNWNINRRATFRFETPVAFPGGARFQVRLVQSYGSQNVLGRARLSFGVEKPDARSMEERRSDNLARRFEAWQQREAGRARSWTRLRPVEARSRIPVLTVEDDASVFVSSDQTKSDTYELKFHPGLKTITAIRLEVLPDDRLPRRGPGRVAYEGPFGDFFLSTFSADAGGQPVKWARASQTYASGGNTADKAIDDDQQSGWSIDGGQGRSHVAVFIPEKPLTDVALLEIRMLFEKYFAAGLGRFRISVTDDARGAEAVNWPDDLQSALVKPATDRSAAERESLLALYLSVAPELASSRAEIDKVRREAPAYSTTLVMRERPAENPRVTMIRNRGDYLQPTQPATAGLPNVFAAFLMQQPRNRLEFARWLVSRENPLSARVAMNRQWSAFFGRGLVRTTEDFGFQGELPTHPELLDWLAVEFMDRGWSQKQMHKLIVMSATYRQSARVTPEALEKDPQNRLLARAPRFRLEAELVRDLALRVSGLLSETVGGPSVFPPQLPSITKEGTYGPLDWTVSRGGDRYRRGLYTFAKRTAPYATFSLFDAPSGESCLARREVSNTPLQSLTLLNDEVFLEAAQALGREALRGEGDETAQARRLFRQILARAPQPEELGRIVSFYRAQLGRIASGELKAEELAGDGKEDRIRHAAWTTVARALLNLDETMTKG